GIGPDPYSIIATGVWTTNALAQQVPIIRTNWFGATPGCTYRPVPIDNLPVQFTQSPMPLCPPLWGLFLDNVTPRAVQIPSPPVFCPGPNFSIRPSRGIVGDSPEYSNSINADSMTVVNLTSSGVDERASDRQALVAFPNPIKRGSAFNLGYTLESSSRVTITVSDMAGKVVFNGSIDQSGGPNRTPVSTDGWASGTYIVQVVSERSTITRRIVIGD
ncbi:MAG: T9SS type A sorting domain-containing protein, partial [Bacteroidota bacterium]